MIGRLLPRTWPARAVWLLALVLVLGLTGDRVTAAVAARMLADKMACAGGRLSVTFGGGLFVPQAVSGRFTDVDVTAKDLRRNDITIAAVDAHLRGASLADRHVAHMSVDVTVGYAALPDSVAGHGVSYRAADGLLAVDTSVDVDGRPVPVTALVEPAISGTTLSLTPRDVEVLGVRAPAGTGLRESLGVTRSLPTLPVGLRYASISAQDNGLRIGIVGDDVTLSNSCGSTP